MELVVMSFFPIKKDNQKLVGTASFKVIDEGWVLNDALLVKKDEGTVFFTPPSNTYKDKQGKTQYRKKWNITENKEYTFEQRMEEFQYKAKREVLDFCDHNEITPPVDLVLDVQREDEAQS